MIETFEIERQYIPYSHFDDPMQQATADMLTLLTVRVSIGESIRISFEVWRSWRKGDNRAEVWVSRVEHVSQKWHADEVDILTLAVEIEKGMLSLEMLDLRVRQLIEKTKRQAEEHASKRNPLLNAAAFIAEADAVLKEMSENAGIQ